jgi:hypothetical protein
MEHARRNVVLENITLRNYILMSVETSHSVGAATYCFCTDERYMHPPCMDVLRTFQKFTEGEIDLHSP